jgi:hypothetical protein
MIDHSRKLGGAVRPYFGGRAAQRPARPGDPDRASQTLARPAPPLVEPPSAVTLDDLPATKSPGDIRAVVHKTASAAGWGVLEMGDDLQIDIRTTGGRSQIVSVAFDQFDREGEPVTVVSSICGPLREQNAAPLLRYNAKLHFGAFAAERMADREEMVVLRATLPSVGVDPAVVARVIAEIAFRADKVEAKLTGRDQF